MELRLKEKRKLIKEIDNELLSKASVVVTTISAAHRRIETIPRVESIYILFNRLISIYPDHNTFLDTQYRMNQKIADISSRMFYNGRLKTHPTVADHDIECEEEILNFNSPVTFLDSCSSPTKMESAVDVKTPKKHTWSMI